MRNIVVVEPGGPEALVLRERAPPSPGPGEVRIRVAAAAVNPVDVLTRSGAFHAAGWLRHGVPVGIGWDVSGAVDALGAGVEGLAIGQPVAALRDRLDAEIGAYADCVVVPAQAVAALPSALDPLHAATLPLNALTAAQGLDLLNLDDGASLLVTGAAGGVGGFALPLAVRRGWRVTALARASDCAFVEAAGAHAAIDTEQALAPRFDAVFDAADLGGTALAAVRDGGAFVGLQPMRPQAEVRGVRVLTARVHHDGAQLAALLALAAAGVLAPRIAGRLPLADAAEAHRRFERGGQRGRWLLLP